MASTITITLVDGVKIVVPNSINLITPYVLIEQRDWFEDEIKFLRKLLQPGQRVVDIGANFGTYTLSIGKAVGERGKVWAFEPASSTANFLAQSITANNFSHIVLDQSALSKTIGSAELHLNMNSELNSLISNEATSNIETETVSITTLDRGMIAYQWEVIDFVKMDAEGEESNILEGGKQFFADFSPLVQYEIKAGAKPNWDLVAHFASLGYDSYRLVPGLNLLIPFDLKATVDGFLLNLFCCKKERATQLEADGFLLSASTLKQLKSEVFQQQVAKKIKTDTYHWHNALTKFPYGAAFEEHWRKTMSTTHQSNLEYVIAAYLFSQDEANSIRERFKSLEDSFEEAKKLFNSMPNTSNSLNLARIAQSYGAREIVRKSLNYLQRKISQSQKMSVNQPFLAPSKRFDTLPVNQQLGNWVLASILEQLEICSAFSSYYTGPAALHRLEVIQKLGFGNAEMKRRLQLVQQRFTKT